MEGMSTKERKCAARSKTLWFNAAVAALGALETALPGTVPPGPALVAISVAGAFLRALTTTPIR